jgi:2,5-dihydroxypyridine 5,6-dioxygenase
VRQHEILATGTKILLAVEPPEVLVRLVPTEADRTRVRAATARLSRAREMHIVSDAGTDLRCALSDHIGHLVTAKRALEPFFCGG